MSWFTSTPCAFPDCDCKGFCVYSPERRRSLHLLQLRASCTFPECTCSSACAYMAYLCPAKEGSPQSSPWEGVPISHATLARHEGSQCPYCGVPMTGARHQPTHDHIHPISKGGPDHSDNILVVCFACNKNKADFTLNEWRIELRRLDDPRAARVANLQANMLARRPGDDNQEAA